MRYFTELKVLCYSISVKKIYKEFDINTSFEPKINLPEYDVFATFPFHTH